MAATRAWVERVVVGLGLCPWAAPLLSAGGLRYVLSDAHGLIGLADELERELRRLAADPPDTPASVLIVIPSILDDWADYLDFLAFGDELLGDLGLVGQLQIASFHPDYIFEGAGAADAANYTNRSPLPLLHLLRERDVAAAVAEHPDSLEVPLRNVSLMERRGLDSMRDLLASCREQPARPTRDSDT